MRKLVTWLVTWAYAAVALVVIMLPARVYTSAGGLLLFGGVPAAIFVAMWRHGLALAMVGGGVGCLPMMLSKHFGHLVRPPRERGTDGFRLAAPSRAILASRVQSPLTLACVL